MNDQKFDLETASAKCPNCSQMFPVLKSIYDYGIFFLVGKEDGIYGTTCALCKKTMTWKKPRSVLDWLKGELGKPRTHDETISEIVYDSFPYISYYTKRENRHSGLYETYIFGPEDSLADCRIDDLGRSELASEGFYDTYFYGDSASGPAIGIGSPKKDDIPVMLEMEKTKGIKVFPRYAPYNKSIEGIHHFCWKYRLLLNHAMDTGMSEDMLWSFQNQRGKVDKPVDFLDLLATEDSPISDNERNEEILRAVWEESGNDRMRRKVSELADEFIEEYIKLHEKTGISYGELIGLKGRYVNKTGDLATEEPEPVSVQSPQDSEVRQGKMSQAKTLIEFAVQNGELFRTPVGEVYIRVEEGDHDRIMEVGGEMESGASKWLRRTYYQKTGNPVTAQNLRDAMATLESFECPTRQVFIRVAGMDDSVYLDLANEKWEQVEITKKEWRIVSNRESPFAFKRSKGMSPLPYPVEGGSLNELRDLLNIQHEEHTFILIVAWLLGTLHPTGPYPIMLLQGEQGSAKSITARTLRDVIDPWSVPLRTLPRSERDLAIAANANWILGFDNLSGLNTLMSDAFCRLATGGGFATRELYTNKGEALFTAKRPLILNGIADIASRQDLAERSLIVRLPPISPSMKKTERILGRTWEDAKPRILGGICSAVSEALRNLEGVKMDDPGRMADFSYWVKAAEPALPWEEGRFEREYKLNRDSLIESAIETDPVATAILTLMESQNEWTGKPADLLGVLSSVAPEAIRRSLDFPKTSNVLSRKVNEAAGFLRNKGIEVERSKSGTRNIRIRKVDQVPVIIQTVLEDPSA